MHNAWMMTAGLNGWSDAQSACPEQAAECCAPREGDPPATARPGFDPTSTRKSLYPPSGTKQSRERPEYGRRPGAVRWPTSKRVPPRPAQARVVKDAPQLLHTMRHDSTDIGIKQCANMYTSAKGDALLRNNSGRNVPTIRATRTPR